MVFISDLTRPLEIVLTLAMLASLWGTRNLGVTGLKCHQCGWDSCGTNEELVECTLERVNQVHGHLQRLVNLPQHQEMPNHAEFVCFELQLTNSHGNRSGTVKSCTLQSAKMCDLNDWQTVKVVNCKTCNDRDYCNGFESPKRDVSGVGFSFSVPRSSSSATSVSKMYRSTAGLRIVALTVTLLPYIHRFFAAYL